MLPIIIMMMMLLMMMMTMMLLMCAVAFKIYDIDGDGFISNGELFQVLKLMVGSNLKESQLQQV